MVVVDHLVHKYDEILCSVHHGGHPASPHGPPVGEGHGEASLGVHIALVSGLFVVGYFCKAIYYQGYLPLLLPLPLNLGRILHNGHN